MFLFYAYDDLRKKYVGVKSGDLGYHSIRILQTICFLFNCFPENRLFIFLPIRWVSNQETLMVPQLFYVYQPIFHYQ